MSSVLVVIVLLGMWAFVLVPLVRQRNTKAGEARSVARFSSALRVLSRGHSLGSSNGSGSGSGSSGWGLSGSGLSGWGHRQWVMPPREGLAAARVRRLAAAAASPQRPSQPAVRRRKLLLGLAGAVTFTLLLVLVAGRLFLVLQVLADCAFVAGILACRSSVAQEQAVAARSRRRRETAELRTSLREALPGADRGRPRSSASDDGSVLMTVPLHAAVSTMTVPLDAPALPRRAVPIEAVVAAVSDVPVVPAVQAQHPGLHPGLRRSAARHEDPPAAAARRVPPSRPRAEPVILAEIDLDWEPAVPEPSSCVRLIDLSGSRRTPIFDESPAEGVDVGDDAELDALVQRRLTASGW